MPEADPACTCHVPGYCPHHGRSVSRTGARVWARGDARGIAMYFGGPERAYARAAPVPVAKRSGDCAYLGEAVMEAGRHATRLCPTCSGTVRLKLFECSHPRHAADPQTTSKGCKACPDWTDQVVTISRNPELDYWRGGS